MSLHEELQNLDNDKLGNALAVVLRKTFLVTDGKSDVEAALINHYPALSMMPDAIADTFEEMAPDVDTQWLANIRAGATLLGSLLCEYAQMVELEANFPDMPRPE